MLPFTASAVGLDRLKTPPKEQGSGNTGTPESQKLSPNYHVVSSSPLFDGSLRKDDTSNVHSIFNGSPRSQPNSEARSEVMKGTGGSAGQSTCTANSGATGDQ
ncbi:hypothetical protein QFC24_006694 [Naganishia onofrii]|uniref:Uncharacterized protein n=1 Tax=Naganishia onofrii TaxID=1851511 RepID=A0ACC2WXZ1_9TREE|nr:hypothetical protein QFC24_006694 [Naganishia onofrii]